MTAIKLNKLTGWAVLCRKFRTLLHLAPPVHWTVRPDHEMSFVGGAPTIVCCLLRGRTRVEFGAEMLTTSISFLMRVSTICHFTTISVRQSKKIVACSYWRGRINSKRASSGCRTPTGIEFVQLRPVLLMHLNWFHFDFLRNRSFNVNDHFEFSRQIDLIKFTTAKGTALWSDYSREEHRRRSFLCAIEADIEIQWFEFK
jgi:hypothetical protein